jgi:putative peptidoglycan lipid II flippase
MTTEKEAPDAVPAGAGIHPSRVSGRRLIAKTSVVSGMTLLSRVLGLVRDIVFARFFGASLVMDAFLVANRIPNMLRRFFAEGAFSQGFVPVMARYRERHDHEEAREFVDAVAGTFGLILFLVTLAGVVAAPLLVAIVAPGFIGEDGRFDLATLMLRFTFPYLFFVSLTAFAGGILNTYGRFGVPAFTPVILNVVLIAGAVWLSPKLEEPGMALAYARHAADAARDLRFVGRADQRTARRDHRIDAKRREDQPAVLLRPADGVSARPVRHRARDRDVAVPLAAGRQ